MVVVQIEVITYFYTFFKPKHDNDEVALPSTPFPSTGVLANRMDIYDGNKSLTRNERKFPIIPIGTNIGK